MITGTGFDATGAVDQVYRQNGRVKWYREPSDLDLATQIVVTEFMAGAAPFTQPYIVKVWNPNGQLSNGMPLTLNDEVAVLPGSGTAGTVFAYSSSGFTGNVGVTSHLKRPDGTEFATLQIPTSPTGDIGAGPSIAPVSLQEPTKSGQSITTQGSLARTWPSLLTDPVSHFGSAYRDDRDCIEVSCQHRTSR